MLSWAWSRLVPRLTNYTSGVTTKFLQSNSHFHSLTCESGLQPISPGGLFNVTTRNNIRVHFPKPSERKRIKRHGWKARMSTPEGRRIIMNRILKGRFVWTH